MNIVRRVPIRDNNADSQIKPRLFDYVVDEAGNEYLQCKDGKHFKTVMLSDIQKQILAARRAS